MSILRSMSEGRYSVFEYQYRDAANYKQYETVCLLGDFKSYDLIGIESKLNSDGMFVPEFVGLPPLQSRSIEFPSSDDHIWHEFISLHAATAEEAQSFPRWGDLSALLANFAALPLGDSDEMARRIASLFENEPYSLMI